MTDFDVPVTDTLDFLALVNVETCLKEEKNISSNPELELVILFFALASQNGSLSSF